MTLTWPNLGVEPRGWKTPHPRHFSLSLSAFYRNKFVLKINIKWHHRRDQLLLIFVCFWVKQADIQLQVWHNNLYSFHAYINLNDFWNSKQDICKFLSCLLVAINSNQYSINKAWIIKNYWVNWRFFLASKHLFFIYIWFDIQMNFVRKEHIYSFKRQSGRERRRGREWERSSMH